MNAPSKPLRQRSQAGAVVNEPTYQIEEVAERLGMTKRTLRYYEERGLLSPAARTEGGYRLYSDADIQRLERIKELRDLLGFSLAEISELIQADEERSALVAAYRQEADPAAKLARLAELDALTRRQLDLVRSKIAGLERMRSRLEEKLTHYDEHRKELERLRATNESPEPSPRP
jgi:DNA-binding transcriptional MerR regulator